MCGRFTLAVQLNLITDRFLLTQTISVFTPRYNIAPTQFAPVIIQKSTGRSLELMRWGLIPHWAKDESVGNKMINARAETVAEKPSYRKSLESRRCIVPADGFYEWKKSADGKTKHPMRFIVNQGDLFGFAGLWDSWHDSNGSDIQTFTIITTEPNETVAPVHNRMPVILQKVVEDRWLDPTITQVQQLLPLLTPFTGKMSAFEVSRAVNSPSNDTPDLILPANLF